MTFHHHHSLSLITETNVPWISKIPFIARPFKWVLICYMLCTKFGCIKIAGTLTQNSFGLIHLLPMPLSLLHNLISISFMVILTAIGIKQRANKIAFRILYTCILNPAFGNLLDNFSKMYPSAPCHPQQLSNGQMEQLWGISTHIAHVVMVFVFCFVRWNKINIIKGFKCTIVLACWLGALYMPITFIRSAEPELLHVLTLTLQKIK